jgi:hypothetical protein
MHVAALSRSAIDCNIAGAKEWHRLACTRLAVSRVPDHVSVCDVLHL